MTSVVPLIGYACICTGISFLCSLLESILLSIPYTYVAQKAEEGAKNGIRMRTLKDNIDRPLSAILTMNTIAHTVGASGVGAEAAKVFGTAYVTITSVVLTLVILLFSEIVPKTVGARNCKKLMGFATTTIRTMMFITYPLVIMCEFLQKCVSPGGGHASGVSRDEISTIVRLGLDQHAVNEEEARIMENILHLRDYIARDVMTPSTVIHAAQASSTISEILDQGIQHFTRIPVYGDHIDDALGFVHRNRLHAMKLEGKGDTPLREAMEPVKYCMDTDKLSTIMNRMVKERVHMMLVTDEFGATDGLITLEDVLETLLGAEIVDEFDEVTDMRARAVELAKARRDHIGLRTTPELQRGILDLSGSGPSEVQVEVHITANEQSTDEEDRSSGPGDFRPPTDASDAPLTDPSSTTV